ncbi:unnamed protein product [Trichogramma brassicae]|uniref:Uncharacterized protein n=1 Tax=Trichogramma brassicae TaxID=86971 RepID=A0A6H5I1G1_9HYME|nr:unnamed protein product [Trichogramma brassicae]
MNSTSAWSSELREIQQGHTEDGQALAEIREDWSHRTRPMHCCGDGGCQTAWAGPSSSTGCLEDCEVRLFGHSSTQLHPCDRSTVERVLTALEERELLPHVLRIREWNVKRRAPTHCFWRGCSSCHHLLLPRWQCVISFRVGGCARDVSRCCPRFQRLPVCHKSFELPDAGDGRFERIADFAD